MNQKQNIVVGIVISSIIITAGYRIYTQIDRVQTMLEKEGYNDVYMERNHKLTGRCSGEDYQSFSFSGTKDKQKLTGNVCCERLYFMMEECKIIQIHPVKQ